MEHDSNLNPWIQQLESAVKPYLQFVDQVAEAVADLEPRVMEALRAPAVHVPAQAASQASDPQVTTPMIIGIEPEKFHALERELADQVLIRKSQQAKIDELKAQIATMASASPSVLPAASSEPLSEAVASASAMDLEKFLALEKELEEHVQAAKNQQEKIDELQAQTTLLKTALMEAKAQAMTASESASEAQAKLQTIESTHSAELAQAKAEILRMTKALDAAQSMGDLANDAPTSIDTVTKRRESRASAQKIPAFPERHVLLVDDAEINRVLMSHYFKGLPVKLEFAVSVDAALEKCKARRFDLIVIDDELVDLENPILRSSSSQIVGLSNRVGSTSTPSRFDHVLSRGQAREAFVEQLKGFLWDAERIA